MVSLDGQNLSHPDASQILTSLGAKIKQDLFAFSLVWLHNGVTMLLRIISVFLGSALQRGSLVAHQKGLRKRLKGQ